MKVLQPGLRHRVDEAVQALLGVLVVDADAALHRHRQDHRRAHRRDGLRDKRRLGHQAGAEASGLHAVGRTADIQIDLVVAEVRADARGAGQLVRITAAELEADRMLLRREAEHALAIAVKHRVRGHHLGVEERALRDQPQEIAAVAVGPLHHRRHAKAVRARTHAIGLKGVHPPQMAHAWAAGKRDRL